MSEGGKTAMRITHHLQAKAVYVTVNDGKHSYTKEISRGVIVDFDCDNCVIGIEILDVPEVSLEDITNKGA